jgi:hypothetical protein
MTKITESTLLRCLTGGLLLLMLAGVPAWAQSSAGPGEPPPGAVGFDVERQIWLYDTDGDTFPDLTEEIGGTDPFDEHSNPRALMEAAAVEHGGAGPGVGNRVGFTRRECRPGFVWHAGGPNLCISQYTQNAVKYTQAQANCRLLQARVCTYEDLGYLYLSTNMDAAYDPAGGKWLADFTLDNNVNCGNASITFNNDPEIWDFEGTCDKSNQRAYWCCHDRDPLHPAP